jgi:hypothetical protein
MAPSARTGAYPGDLGQQVTAAPGDLGHRFLPQDRILAIMPGMPQRSPG